jgi:two-component system response regulator (stage 0 sporulation protein F)
MSPTTTDDWDDDESPRTVRSQRLDRARILIADDDGEMRRVVVDTLHSDGYEVRQAASGRALLETVSRIDTHAFPMDGVDLVLLDHRMPGMTGLDAVRTLRGCERRVPVILMTAYPDARLEDEAKTLDVTVLPKPFTRAELSRTVLAKLLGRSPSLRAES